VAIATIREFSEGIDLIEFVLFGQVGTFCIAYRRFHQAL